MPIPFMNVGVARENSRTITRRITMMVLRGQICEMTVMVWIFLCGLKRLKEEKRVGCERRDEKDIVCNT